MTISEILDNAHLKRLTDRSENIDDILEILISEWESKDTIDVAGLIFMMSKRMEDITIPHYKSIRPTTLTEGQTSPKENRHGKIVGLSANKDIFSFGIKIFDESVINEGKPDGDFRNFSVTDPSGELLDGWKTKIPIFVNSNRWADFYSLNYFLSKVMIDRLTDEAKNIFSQIKTMKKNGLKLPTDDVKKEWPKTTKALGKSVTFTSLDVEVDFIDYINKYKVYDETQENLVLLTEKRKKIIYTIIPILRFTTRCTELAFFQHNDNRIPNWQKNVKWEIGFKIPGKKIKWDRIQITETCSIRKRIKSKKETMAKDY